MKVLVTGVSGQLGHDVVNELAKRGHHAVGTDIHPSYGGMDDGSFVVRAPYVQLDITDEDAVKRIVSELRPDAVVHCAAWTKVDAAEEAENKALVFRINALGTEYLARASKDAGAKMLYISTDYVFKGEGSLPWDPDDKNFAPISYYGETKLAGEQAVSSILEKYFIVRIAWVFGKNGQNFVRTMLKVGKTRDAVRVVNDQIGTPTYTLDLARLLVDMIESEKYGFYHATNEGGFISWYDFTREIYREAGLSTAVIPVTTEEYGLSKAKRPKNSRLSKEKLVLNGFKPLPDWRSALHRYLAEIGEIEA